MMNAFILHGIYGDPEENWFPWLKQELQQLKIETHIPHFPTIEPRTPLKSWTEAWEPYDAKVSDQSLIIGHSLGVAFGLSIIERHPVKAAFLVATAWGVTRNEFDPIMGEIADQSFDWDAIRNHCSHFEIFHADNDPYLPLERPETLAKNLGCTLTVIKGAWHFNAKAGYT